jgi:hypothetical protein
MDPPAFRTPDAHMNRHIKELWHGGGKCPDSFQSHSHQMLLRSQERLLRIIPRVLRRALNRRFRGYVTSHSLNQRFGTIDSADVRRLVRRILLAHIATDAAIWFDDKGEAGVRLSYFKVGIEIGPQASLPAFNGELK